MDSDWMDALPGTRFINQIKVLAAIGVLAALLGSPAFAADLEQAPPRPVAPYAKAPAVAPPNWSGPYAGVGIGFRFSAVDANITSANAGTTAIPLPPVDPGTTSWWAFWENNMGAMQYIDNIALRGSLYAGWNFQVSPIYVIGFEVDAALANERSVFHGSPYPANLQINGTPLGASFNDAFSVKTLWDGSARLRGGWLANPSTLLYVTGGVAWAAIQASSGCSTTPTANVANCAPGGYFGGTLGPDSITHSATKLGWTAGVGAEMWLWSNWILRVQYRYADFGFLAFGSGSGFNFSDTRTCSGAGCSSANSPLNVNYNLRLMQHNFDFGIAYKF